MSDLETRVRTLLRDAVGQPPTVIDPQSILTGRPTRQVRRIVAPLLAAVVVAAVAIGVVAATSAGTRRAPASQPPDSRTWHDAHITVTYPASWQALTYRGALAPSTYPLLDVVNEPVDGTNTFDGAVRIPATAVDIRFTYVERAGLSLSYEPGRSTTIGGQPAKLTTGRCRGGGTSIDAAVLVGARNLDPTMLLAKACLGSRTTAADRAAARRVVSGVTFPSARPVGSIRGQLIITGGPAPGLPRPMAGRVTARAAHPQRRFLTPVHARVSTSGRFTVGDLATGTYRVTTSCSSATVTVRAGAVADVKLVCDVP